MNGIEPIPSRDEIEAKTKAYADHCYSRPVDCGPNRTECQPERSDNALTALAIGLLIKNYICRNDIVNHWVGIIGCLNGKFCKVNMGRTIRLVRHGTNNDKRHLIHIAYMSD